MADNGHRGVERAGGVGEEGEGARGVERDPDCFVGSRLLIGSSRRVL